MSNKEHNGMRIRGKWLQTDEDDCTNLGNVASIYLDEDVIRFFSNSSDDEITVKYFTSSEEAKIAFNWIMERLEEL